SGQANHECDAEEVARTVDEGTGQLLFAHATDDPDYDREQEEQRRQLREPPRARRDPGNAKITPRDHADDHDHERQTKQEQDQFALASQFWDLVGVVTLEEMPLVVLLHLEDERLRRVSFDARRVAHYPPH